MSQFRKIVQENSGVWGAPAKPYLELVLSDDMGSREKEQLTKALKILSRFLGGHIEIKGPGGGGMLKHLPSAAAGLKSDNQEGRT